MYLRVKTTVIIMARRRKAAKVQVPMDQYIPDLAALVLKMAAKNLPLVSVPCTFPTTAG